MAETTIGTAGSVATVAVMASISNEAGVIICKQTDAVAAIVTETTTTKTLTIKREKRRRSSNEATKASSKNPMILS